MNRIQISKLFGKTDYFILLLGNILTIVSNIIVLKHTQVIADKTEFETLLLFIRYSSAFSILFVFGTSITSIKSILSSKRITKNSYLYFFMGVLISALGSIILIPFVFLQLPFNFFVNLLCISWAIAFVIYNLSYTVFRANKADKSFIMFIKPMITFPPLAGYFLLQDWRVFFLLQIISVFIGLVFLTYAKNLQLTRGFKILLRYINFKIFLKFLYGSLQRVPIDFSFLLFGAGFTHFIAISQSLTAASEYSLSFMIASACGLLIAPYATLALPRYAKKNDPIHVKLSTISCLKMIPFFCIFAIISTFVSDILFERNLEQAFLPNVLLIVLWSIFLWFRPVFEIFLSPYFYLSIIFISCAIGMILIGFFNLTGNTAILFSLSLILLISNSSIFLSVYIPNKINSSN